MPVCPSLPMIAYVCLYSTHNPPDRGERSHVRHPVHLQRVAGVPGVLAHLLHHGRADVRRKVLQVPQRYRRGAHPHRGEQLLSL